MDLLSVIRRWHFRQEISIREIKRRTGLSRNTIRKYLRSDAVDPSFKVPVRPSKLDPFADKLAARLRVPIPSWPTAAPSSCGPICSKPMRCCSMR